MSPVLWQHQLHLGHLFSAYVVHPQTCWWDWTGCLGDRMESMGTPERGIRKMAFSLRVVHQEISGSWESTVSRGQGGEGTWKRKASVDPFRSGAQQVEFLGSNGPLLLFWVAKEQTQSRRFLMISLGESPGASQLQLLCWGPSAFPLHRKDVQKDWRGVRTSPALHPHCISLVVCH